MRRLTTSLLVLSLLSAPATANVWPPPPEKVLTQDDLADPAQQPNDPGYAGEWGLWGFVQPSVRNNPGFRAEEIALGSGMSADRAWQLSTGSPLAIIAVTDSGFRWEERDLVNKWALNRGELPPPQDAQGETCSACPDPHDRDGDGAFTVRDFTDCAKGEQPTLDRVQDPRLTSRADKGDVNGNGILDPQDLMAIFSDGVDDDGNGFVDDICGWDFFWDDQDAEDDVFNGGTGYSHGTGEARDAAAEGNNGIGSIGVCPDCLILPLRVSDSFVADDNHFADAVLYATDMGATALLEALGGVNNTPYMQAAIDYGYQRGLPIIASAADETSHHHNYPGNAEHMLYTHAIVYDGRSHDSPDTTTFLNFNNCTNWGGHLYLSVPAKACSSEAVGLGGGQAGLLKAYAMQLGVHPPLTAQETMELMYLNVDDIDVKESATDPTKFPSWEGWDPYFGYGRNNVYKSLRALKEGRIPPEVDILRPRWFETVDPAKPLPILASVAAQRAPGGFDWKVEIARGIHARESDFEVVASGSGKDALTAAKLAELDVSRLFEDPTRAPDDPHDFAVNVRVRAVAHYGGAVGDVPGEFRKTFFVHRDPALHPGWPRYLGASGEGSPKLVDLNGDGKDDLVVATADGLVHAFTITGEELPGFPVKAKPRSFYAAHADLPALKSGAIRSDYLQTFVNTVAVGDLDGDGVKEIVASSFDGELYVWDATGVPRPGFPIRMPDDGFACFQETATGCRPAGEIELPPEDGKRAIAKREIQRGYFASPVLYDLDGDGLLEIVQAGLDGLLHVYRADGRPQPGFPVALSDPRGGLKDGSGARLYTRARIIGTPAVGDVDGDGIAEILAGTNEVYENKTGARGYLVRGTGAPSLERSHEAYLPGWPVRLSSPMTEILPFLGRGVPGSPVMVDADGDGKIDLLHIQPLASPGEFYDASGRRVAVAESSEYGEASNSQEPFVLTGLSSGAIGDLDGDGLPDYVNGLLGANAIGGASGGKRVHFEHLLGGWSLGRQFRRDRPVLEQDRSFVSAVPFLRGFPQIVDDHQFLNNYVIADVDGDGKAEVIGGSGGYTIHAFNAEGARPAGWPKFNGGWVIGTPALGDLDGDGFLDLVAITREGWLFAWRTTGPADQKLDWESFHHDAQNTGNTLVPIPPRAGPKKPLDLGPDWVKDGTRGPLEGCGCGSTSGSALLPVALAALALLRRRA